MKKLDAVAPAYQADVLRLIWLQQAETVKRRVASQETSANRCTVESPSCGHTCPVRATVEALLTGQFCDQCFRGLLWWLSRVLLLLPLERTVPRRQLRWRQRDDLVDVGHFGIAAVVGVDELTD